MKKQNASHLPFTPDSAVLFSVQQELKPGFVKISRRKEKAQM
jgi:hypothetical protein